jgi:putative toxin-antitoxin system antitoxin component (TIGR02293 family)
MIKDVNLGKVIGVSKTLAEKLSDTEELRQLLTTGFPYAPFESVLRRLGLTRVQVGKALGLPERTLARRKQEGKFQSLESDRIFRFLQVAAHAIETLGDDEKAGRWLTRPNRALTGKSPLELFNTPIGASEVDEILGRIDHGLYS